MNLLWDPLFRIPLATGLMLALLLPLLGAGLRLRQQWLAGLGLTQMAAAGAVLAALLHLPLLLGGGLTALAAAALRVLSGEPRNEHYALMLLVGWAGVLLLAMQGHHADALVDTVLNGQLYFTDSAQLMGASLVTLTVLAAGTWLSRRLLLSRLFPAHFQANQQSVWPHEFTFDLLLVAGLVLAVTSMGVMASFALLFVPPWVAFRLARGLRMTLWLCVGLGSAAYLASFAIALWLDLPFGPVLVAACCALAPLRWLGRIGWIGRDGRI